MTSFSFLMFAAMLGASTVATGAETSPAAHPVLVAANHPDQGYAQKLATARTLYFEEVQGRHSDEDDAQKSFDALLRERPADPVPTAYVGSLELLESARTWAVWRKHELANEGLAKLDSAVTAAPDNLEARFVRALTTWHLPFFFHRKEQAEGDLAFIAPRAEQAAARGILPPPLAAAALDYWGQVLEDRDDAQGARNAYQTALRIDSASPGGVDAGKRLKR